MAEPLPLSIVIATLGGPALRDTIACLNSGERIPAEILVCIPKAESENQVLSDFENVRLIPTPCRGQVAQRAYGLRLARQDIVMQIDDDIILLPQSLQALLSTLLTLGTGNVVAPFYRHSEGPYITRYRDGWHGIFQSLQTHFICGAPWGLKRMGKLSPAGIGYWFDRTRVSDAPIESEWIPGGCAVCFKADLVLDAYFPYAGKAYSEDLIHSVLWRRKGVRLWAVPCAECMTAVVSIPFDWRQMSAAFRAHLYVVDMIDGEAWRLRLWFAIFVFKQGIGHLWRRLGHRST